MEKSLYEIEREARRMRSREIGRVLRAGARGVVSLFKSALNLFSAKVVRHA